MLQPIEPFCLQVHHHLLFTRYQEMVHLAQLLKCQMLLLELMSCLLVVVDKGTFFPQVFYQIRKDRKQALNSMIWIHLSKLVINNLSQGYSLHLIPKGVIVDELNNCRVLVVLGIVCTLCLHIVCVYKYRKTQIVYVFKRCTNMFMHYCCV